jgi:uncharacterized protein (TIGR03435 family)
VTPLFLIDYSAPHRSDQIMNAPDWIKTEFYDVVAITGEPFPLQGETPCMVRALLADRFRLLAHVEQRDAAIYTLELARADRKLSDQMRPSTFDCAAFTKNPAAVQAAVFDDVGKTPCTTRSRGPAALVARDVTMTTLAGYLTGVLKQQVIDRTGLAGQFSFELTYAPDSVDPATFDPPRPSLFTAVQELGLKLEHGRGPQDMLVIDRIERPTEN